MKLSPIATSFQSMFQVTEKPKAFCKTQTCLKKLQTLVYKILKKLFYCLTCCRFKWNYNTTIAKKNTPSPSNKADTTPVAKTAASPAVKTSVSSTQKLNSPSLKTLFMSNHLDKENKMEFTDENEVHFAWFSQENGVGRINIQSKESFEEMRPNHFKLGFEFRDDTTVDKVFWQGKEAQNWHHNTLFVRQLLYSMCKKSNIPREKINFIAKPFFENEAERAQVRKKVIESLKLPQYKGKPISSKRLAPKLTHKITPSIQQNETGTTLTLKGRDVHRQELEISMDIDENGSLLSTKVNNEAVLSTESVPEIEIWLGIFKDLV